MHLGKASQSLPTQRGVVFKNLVFFALEVLLPCKTGNYPWGSLFVAARGCLVRPAIQLRIDSVFGLPEPVDVSDFEDTCSMVALNGNQKEPPFWGGP